MVVLYGDFLNNSSVFMCVRARARERKREILIASKHGCKRWNEHWNSKSSCEGAHDRPPNLQKKCADSNSEKDAFEAKHKRHERKSLKLLLEKLMSGFAPTYMKK